VIVNIDWALSGQLNHCQYGRKVTILVFVTVLAIIIYRFYAVM